MSGRVNLSMKKGKGNHATISFINCNESDVERYQKNYCFVLHITHHTAFFKNPVLSGSDLVLGSLPHPLVNLVDFYTKSTEKIDFVSYGKRIVRDLISGLHHLHKRRCILGDIHPSNIFISSGSDVNVKYGDLTIATTVADRNDYFVLPSSVTKHEYFAPETVFDNKCFFVSDVYSLGLVWISVFTGKFVETWSNISIDDPRTISTEALRISQEVEKCDMLKYVLTMEASQRMPLIHVYDLFIEIFNVPIPSNHGEHPISSVFDLIFKDQIKDACLFFLQELMKEPQANGVEDCVPVILSLIISKFYFVESCYSTFMFNEVLNPFIEVCLYLNKTNLLSQSYRIKCCQKRLKTLCFLALDQNLDFFSVISVFAEHGLIQITGPVVTECLKMKVCTSQLKSLTTKLGTTEWDDLLESVAARDDTLKRKLSEQSEEIQRCKKIRETLTSILNS